MGRRGWLTALSVGAALALAAVAVILATGNPGPSAHKSPPLPTVSTTSAPSTRAPVAAPSSPWTAYHGNALGTGVDTSGVTFSPPVRAWTSPALDGAIYGEPLESTGRVFVATESDSIYALAADTGAILWRTSVGRPVPSSDLPCGDIQPTVGITGTPVIDKGRAEIFAVADEIVNGRIAHHLVGLDVYTGSIELNQDIALQGSDQAAQLQRTGLDLSQGNVLFGFGGNYGDCGTYHGWVVAVPEGGGGQLSYEVDSGPGQREGAVWMGGAAPEVDGGGNIWVAVGNGSVTSPDGAYDYGDSVIELSPQLKRLQFFAPTSWAHDNALDADLGSSAPALIANGTVLQVGKSHTAFELNAAALGGIGGQERSLPACPGGDASGGDAVDGTIVYVPCAEGVQEIRTSPDLRVVATAPSGASGPPIIAGGLVWSIGGGTLYGMDPASLATVQQVPIGSPDNHFPTPSVGDGLLLAPGGDQVYAFAGSAGIPGPPETTPR